MPSKSAGATDSSCGWESGSAVGSGSRGISVGIGSTGTGDPLWAYVSVANASGWDVKMSAKTSSKHARRRSTDSPRFTDDELGNRSPIPRLLLLGSRVGDQ